MAAVPPGMIATQVAAADIVTHVLEGRSLDAELRAAQAAATDWAPADRGALQDLAYGTLRFLGPVDAWLDALLTRPLRSDRLRNLLRVALYQLAHTRAAPHAIVDHAVRACESLHEPAARGLVNAVLRNFLRRRDEVAARANDTDRGRYSHPQWWIDQLRSEWPEHWASLLHHANSHPPLTLRVNERTTGVDAYLQQLTAAGIEAEALGGSAVKLHKPMSVDRVPGFGSGLVSVQDASAQYAAHALGAGPGSRVLDACAAPGGKTAHVLERAELELVALDQDDERLARVAANLRRLGLTAEVKAADAGEPVAWWDRRPFTHILADVPCTGSGVVRRHPDIKWLRRRADIEGFAKQQRRLIDALWPLLTVGGKLLYATCSVFREENGGQIEAFLERHGDAHCLPLPGPQTKVEQVAGQLLPDANHDGFFYALLQKI